LTKKAGPHVSPKKIVEDFRRKPLWWREIFYVLVLYGIYSVVRNVQGSVLSVTTANDNALDIVELQKTLHIFNEQAIQEFFLPNDGFIKALNIYYGTAHFVVTIGVLFWLFHLKTERYHRYRNIIFATTGLALIGYMSYPLTPPRLLPASYGFVDTLRTIGGTWSFDNDAVENVSNQYAAMPSLHVGWALWCAFAVAPTLRNWVLRAGVFLYPALTTLAIVVTGNHYWMDVVGGALVFAGGWGVAALVARRSPPLGIPMTEADATVGARTRETR